MFNFKVQYISLYMLHHPNRRSGRGSMITDCSVHNQCIESVFGEMLTMEYCICITTYFIILKIETDLFALHYVFKSRINHHQSMWKDGYIRHHIRTAGHRTPIQLYILGLLQMRETQQLPAQEVYEQ